MKVLVHEHSPFKTITPHLMEPVSANNREIKVLTTAGSTSFYERKTMNWELIIALTIFSLVLGWISDVAKGLIKGDKE